MKIKKIVIQNYKSIKNIDITLSEKVNVFIGENSVGKSNIFSAIEWLLGPVYPSFNNFPKEDYYRGDENSHVIIELHFDDGHFLQMNNNWRDRYGNKKSGLNIDGNGYVSDDIRQKYISAFIGPDRKIVDNPASNRWSLLGRLLRDINARFLTETMTDPYDGEVKAKSELFKSEMQRIRDEFLFSVKDEYENNVMETFTNILRTETARQLNRKPSDFNVDLNMYDPWNLFKTLQIMVNEAETGMTFRASELGMGVQASITIAILKAYSQLKLKNQTPIFIDEPELYLHPQGRRNFHSIIRDLADNDTQIFITTHSTEFISLDRFNEINVVRKSLDKGTYIRKADPIGFVTDLKIRKNIDSTEEDLMFTYKDAYENTGDSQRASEAMFARKVILVEGESESLILPYFFDLLGYDYIAEGVTIVRCGGKSEIDRFYRLYSEFGIPCFVIFDGDKQNIGKSDEKATIDKNHGILKLFGCEDDFPDGDVHEKYLGFEYRLEENLQIGDVGKAKALRLYVRTKKAISSPGNVPVWVSEVIKKLELLPNEAESVLLKNNY
ncbi:ATP-dependent nuclease [Phascolarctobacterium succinatutens]